MKTKNLIMAGIFGLAFLITFIVPDPLPLIDEILLGGFTALEITRSLA